MTSWEDKWVIVTSNETRHRYLANQLAKLPQVIAVVSEPKKRNPARLFSTPEEEKFLKDYFQKRTESEESILSSGSTWQLPAQTRLFDLGSQSINDPSITDQLWELNIRNCIIFGSSLLKDPWLTRFGKKMINLHLGLSPYYRGAGTNFWALHNQQPQFVGSTLHLIDAGVDSGAILQHVRPDPAPQDDAHSLGNKVIAKSVKALAALIQNPNQFEPIPQWHEPTGREYKMKDFNAGALKVLLQNIESGLIRKYAADPASFYSGPIQLIREYQPFYVHSQKNN